MLIVCLLTSCRLIYDCFVVVVVVVCARDQQTRVSSRRVAFVLVGSLGVAVAFVLKVGWATFRNKIWQMAQIELFRVFL